MEVRCRIKPLSANKAWQGKRFKSPEYKAYEKELMYTLPARKLPKPPYKIYFEFGFSNMASDWDNPIKQCQDVLALKYGFNDKDILEGHVRKMKTKKGEEYFIARLETIED